MPENDISWAVLRRIVQDWAGAAADLAEVKPLAGGCINTTLALKTRDGARAVLKISPHRVNREYAREAQQLQLLREHGLPAPQVYACKIGHLDDPHSYLLMEHIDGVDLKHARQQCGGPEYDRLQTQLADLVLAMHAQTGLRYQRVGEESAVQFDNWPEFYHHVYDPVLREAERTNLLAPKVRKVLWRVHERLGSLLQHDDQPRLVHWDIWATNVLAAPNGDGHWRITGLVDPNCKYAHFEAEIAYMELFGTVTQTFLKAYQAARRLPAEYHARRKIVYQIYPLLNHVQLFGAEYVKPLLALVEKAASLT